MIFLFESPAWGFSSHVDDTEARCFLWMKNTTCLRSAACALPRIGNPTSETEIVAAKKTRLRLLRSHFWQETIRVIYLKEHQKMLKVSFVVFLCLSDFMWSGVSSLKIKEDWFQATGQQRIAMTRFRLLVAHQLVREPRVSTH